MDRHKKTGIALSPDVHAALELRLDELGRHRWTRSSYINHLLREELLNHGDQIFDLALKGAIKPTPTPSRRPAPYLATRYLQVR